MIKKCLLFIILILLINNVSANTLLPNNINDTAISYSNNSVDNIYNLNISDSLMQFKIDYEIDKNKFPYTIIYTFNDTHGNILKIANIYSYNEGYVFDNIILKINILFNNKLLYISSKGGINITDYYYNTTEIHIPFSTSIYLNNNYLFVLNQIILKFIYVNKHADYNIFFISQIQLPNISGLTYNNIYIKYQDNGIASIKNDIDTAYNNLNIVFKLIFLLFEGITSFASWTSIITNVDMFEYQLYFITPLEYIDYFIGLFFNILKFISLMGMFWTFVIIECIIFIFNWNKYGDILDTITYTFYNSKEFWNIVIFKPLNWIFTKLLLFWTGK